MISNNEILRSEDAKISYSNTLTSIACSLNIDSKTVNMSHYGFVESILCLVNKLRIKDVKVDKIPALLSNYDLLNPLKIDGKSYAFSQAMKTFNKFCNYNMWTSSVDLYKASLFDSVRMFNINDNKFSINSDLPKEVFEKREDIYYEHILSYRSELKKKTCAKDGNRVYSYKYSSSVNNEKQSLIDQQVKIPPLRIASGISDVLVDEKFDATDEITVLADELIITAKQIDKLSGSKHYERVIKNIFKDKRFLTNKNSKFISTDGIKIKHLCHMIGMVSSGKSVFATTLAVALTNKGLKTVMLFRTASDCLAKSELFNKVGVSSCPVVSFSGNAEYLNQAVSVFNNQVLPDNVSSYIDTPCILDGYNVSNDEACARQYYPCSKLRKVSNNKTTQAQYDCPLKDVCPSRNAFEGIGSSSIICTTYAGFVQMKLNNNQNLFEDALDNADLLIVDECDCAQSDLDARFVPELSLNKFVKDCADYNFADDKTDYSFNSDNIYYERYSDIRHEVARYVKSLLYSSSSKVIGGWVSTNVFSSRILYLKLNDAGLPGALKTELDKYFDNYEFPSIEFQHLVEKSCSGVDVDSYNKEVEHYFKTKKLRHEQINDELKEKYKFLIQVIAIDKFIRDISDAYSNLDTKENGVEELNNFLAFSMARQQLYMPKSVRRNQVGFKFTDNNENKNLLIYRQFGFGRSFINSFPWFKMNKDGGPLGPYVLLLSGTSFLPGSYQFHINKDVDYIIKPEERVIEKLYETKVVNLGLKQKVSGSSKAKRLSNLALVTEQCLQFMSLELDNDFGQKCLLVVNNYNEAKFTSDHINALVRKYDYDFKSAYLARDNPYNDPSAVLRADIEQFVNRDEGVLVAPAASIERGYNIVLDSGHALFNSIFFVVRPIAAPSDFSRRIQNMNGIVETYSQQLDTNYFDYHVAIEDYARKKYFQFARCEKLALSQHSNIDKEYNREYLRNITAGLFGQYNQIYGRTVRITEFNIPAPTIYFVDGAFSPESPNSYNTLESIVGYLDDIESEYGEIVDLLYGPLHKTLKKGV